MKVGSFRELKVERWAIVDRRNLLPYCIKCSLNPEVVEEMPQVLASSLHSLSFREDVCRNIVFTSILTV